MLFDGSSNGVQAGCSWALWLDREARFEDLHQVQVAAMGSWSLSPGTSAIDAEIAGANSALNFVRAVLEGFTLDFIAAQAGTMPTTVSRPVRPYARAS